MPSPIEQAVSMHGHLGPNVVIGAKMALYARELLGREDIRVFSKVTDEPPTGCMNDGLRALCPDFQHTGNGKASATFSCAGKEVTLVVKPGLLRALNAKIRKMERECGANTPAYFKEIERLGRRFWESYSPEQLFEVHGTSIHSPEGRKL